MTAARYITTGDGTFTVKKDFIFTPNNIGEYVFPLKVFLKTSMYPEENEYISWKTLNTYVTKVTLNIKDSAGQILGTWIAYVSALTGDFLGADTGVYMFETSDIFQIEYVFYNDGGKITGPATGTITFIAAWVQNRLPLKKWTITDVITRSAELLEPISGNETANRRAPRFRLNGVTYDKSGNVTGKSGQAEEFDKILAPEFAFTKMTFREMLQQVGGYIHAEPRISAEKRDNANKMNYFEIVFDKYGETKQSHIKNKRYFSAGLKTSVNDYCTGLDSSADNLISQIDYAQGVVVFCLNLIIAYPSKIFNCYRF